LSVDGLSPTEIGNLIRLLPKSRPLLELGLFAKLDSGVLTSATAIWAEILTGKPWHHNGCAGYSAPNDSLNNLKVIDEDDLSVPTSWLLRGAERALDVLINIPLARPNKATRIWLADGSLPTNLRVVPRALLEVDPFKDYEPRSSADFATAFSAPSKNISASIASEMNRIDCAMQLHKTAAWSQFIWRITLFDQLAHLAGLDILSSPDLSLFDELRILIDHLDIALYEMLSEPGINWIIMSAFSHVPCRGKANINTILNDGHFLRWLPATMALNAGARQEAVSAITKAPLAKHAHVSMETCIDLKSTVGASPVAGCIWINRAKRFKDGIVSDADYETVFAGVREYLWTVLSQRFASVKIEENPRRTAKQQNLSPDFIIWVEGVEFHNLPDDGSQSSHLPRTTHHPSGFVLTNHANLKSEYKMTPTQVAGLIN
jgi:predicted AlkP superfamily phosphohydrolase/phosphomutase